MYGNASLSMDVSDQLPTLEVDAFSRTLQRRNSQGVLECSASADHLHLIGTVSMTINYLTILNYYTLLLADRKQLFNAFFAIFFLFSL
jgi:hypothetical protein